MEIPFSIRMPEDALIGRKLGKYEIRRKLGGGGMGAVYEGWDPSLSRKVAVKVIKPELSMLRDQFLPRFRREAQAAAQVRHSNVVGIHEYGETDDGIAYIAMEHVEGETLSSFIGRHGRVPPRLAVEIAKQCLRALYVVHRSGVVHRDLKPGNILLVSNGERAVPIVKICDFGLGKLLDDGSGRAGEAPTLTTVGEALGTPKYMSPEQCEGAAVDARSDLYSLGIILFEMLAGHPPYDGYSARGIIARHLSPAPVSRLRNVPAGLADVVAKATEKRASRRYSGNFPDHRDAALAMLRALDAVRLEPRSWNGALIAALAALAVVLGAGGLVLKERFLSSTGPPVAVEAKAPSPPPASGAPAAVEAPAAPPAPAPRAAPAPDLGGLTLDELFSLGETASIEGKLDVMAAAYRLFLARCENDPRACGRRKAFVRRRLDALPKER